MRPTTSSGPDGPQSASAPVHAPRGGDDAPVWQGAHLQLLGKLEELTMRLDTLAQLLASDAPGAVAQAAGTNWQSGSSLLFAAELGVTEVGRALLLECVVASANLYRQAALELRSQMERAA